METNLARALKQYYRIEYTKRGKAIVRFRNQMTLNQLGQKMGELLWERTENVGFGPPSLWRVVRGSGNHLFTTEQLETFSELLKLSYNEQWELEQALAKDHLWKHNLALDTSGPPELADDYLAAIHQVDQRGHPQLAVELAAGFANKLKKMSLQASSPRARIYYLTQCGEALRLKGWALDALTPHVPLAFKMAVIQELYDVANAGSAPVFYAVADALRANSYHIQGNQRAAITYSQKALTNLRNPRDVIFQYRALGLNFARLGDEANYRDAWLEARALIAAWPLNDWEHVIVTLEAFTRAQAQLGLFDQAWLTLEEGKQYYARMKARGDTMASPAVQLIRAELEILKQSQTANKHYMEASAIDAARMAHEHGYQRLGSQVAQLANELFAD